MLGCPDAGLALGCCSDFHLLLSISMLPGKDICCSKEERTIALLPNAPALVSIGVPGLHGHIGSYDSETEASQVQ